MPPGAFCDRSVGPKRKAWLVLLEFPSWKGDNNSHTGYGLSGASDPHWSHGVWDVQAVLLTRVSRSVTVCQASWPRGFSRGFHRYGAPKRT